ncbi:MAG: iron donor protein CyaY [Planctomycetota bacterium]
MDRREFLEKADACIGKVTDWLEDFDPDEVDYSTADGVLTFEFGDGTRFVLNRQLGSNQMWFAAGARAFHYDWSEEAGAWLDSKDGHQLYERIATSVGEKVGRRLSL